MKNIYRNLCVHFHTIDLEIFIVKYFRGFGVNHKNKKLEIYFATKINHYGQHILHTRFHNAATYTYFLQDGSSF